MVPFSVLESAARRASALRSVASEISDLYCDVVYQTERLEKQRKEGWSEEGLALTRLALSEALAALGKATERLARMTRVL